MEYTSETELPELVKKLQNQKKKRNFHGLYDFAVIDLICNLCRLHQQSGFIAALKLAHRLSHELNT